MHRLINGDLAFEGAAAVPLPQNLPSCFLGIGNNLPGGDERFIGNMDEIQIWSIARTQAEIQNTICQTLSGTEPGLMAYYRADEATNDQNVIDTGPSGRHAVLGRSASVEGADPVRVTSTLPALTGDLNGDGAVDLADLATLVAHFGTLSGATLADGDLTGDGTVELADLAILLANFGSTCP